MEIILNIILVISLATIVYQDFKYRAIHVFLVIGILICSCLLFWEHHVSLSPLFYTFVFLISVLVLLWIYFALKNRNIQTIKENIGMGDVLFFFSVAPLFSLRNYMLFFISGMVIALIYFVVFKNLMQTKFIPLAGILSAYLIVLKLLSFNLDIDLFYNPLIIAAFGH